MIKIEKHEEFVDGRIPYQRTKYKISINQEGDGIYLEKEELLELKAEIERVLEGEN